MSGFKVSVQNQSDISKVRVIGVSINPGIRFSVDASQNGEGSESNLQARGNRGLVAYDLGTEEVFATGSVLISPSVQDLTILVFGNTADGYGFDFAFN